MITPKIQNIPEGWNKVGPIITDTDKVGLITTDTNTVGPIITDTVVVHYVYLLNVLEKLWMNIIFTIKSKQIAS